MSNTRSWVQAIAKSSGSSLNFNMVGTSTETVLVQTRCGHPSAAWRVQVDRAYGRASYNSVAKRPETEIKFSQTGEGYFRRARPVSRCNAAARASTSSWVFIPEASGAWYLARAQLPQNGSGRRLKF